MLATLRVPVFAVISSLALAGCAGTDIFGSGAGDVTTSSLAQQQTAKVDPACNTLTAQIDGLRKEGIADKIEKASIKKYKMTTPDLAKADQLTKANADFQMKCSTVPRTATVAAAPVVAAVAPAVKAAAAPAAAKAAPAAAPSGVTR